MDYVHMIFVIKGYTYQIFMCNDPLPKIYLDRRILPLHSRVMEIFDTLEQKHHQCAMDNIYNSAAFFKVAYNYEKITESWCYKEGN